jgi:CofD-related protein of GAK system
MRISGTTSPVAIPDPSRLDRCLRDPGNGPGILFFTGGTALRGVSRRLIEHTHNSVHLVTTFDSGGSSARLRQAFHMPAVGDLRNRMLALVDRTEDSSEVTHRLLSFRFPRDVDPSRSAARLREMAGGKDAWMTALPEFPRQEIERNLGVLLDRMPERFDLRGASIGNLVLAGAYLENERRLEPAISAFSNLVPLRGVVKPIVDGDLHLAAELADGSTVVGQHRLTGKEVPPLTSSIRRLWTAGDGAGLPIRVEAHGGVSRSILSADLICYPMGSFYTSLVANLLVGGVADAIAQSRAPKVYLPNTGYDPEQNGMTLPDRVRTLLDYLKAGATVEASATDLIDYVIVDESRAGFTPEELDEVEKTGIEILSGKLITAQTAPLLDDQQVAEMLTSLADLSRSSRRNDGAELRKEGLS